MRSFNFKTLIVTLVAAAVAGGPARSNAADHGDAPGVRLDTRLDINDVYIFQSPATPANTVIIVTTNPLAGITGPLTYSDEGTYEILIDNNDDSKEDITYRFNFKKPNASNVQKFDLFRVNKGQGNKGTRVVKGSTGQVVSINTGGQVQASVFDDPFFFDLLAFRNSLSFSQSAPDNFFRGLNTLAIVLEVPSASLVRQGGSTSIGVWARTIAKNQKQVDRMGRPAINTVLVKSANKDKFNKGKPSTDAQYRADAIDIIKSLGNSQQNAESLAATLFPDILTFDTASTSGFLNGRKLADDVIDAELQLLTGNNAASDFVSSDSNFKATFPYLADKNP